MAETNQEQIDYWNGNAGTQWVQAQEHLDALLAPLSQQALSAAIAGATERVLDVGCGCGATSLQLAKQARAVTGVDISAPMLARAQQRAAEDGQDNVTFLEADATTWQDSEPFQLAFSRFGVMFFADSVASFRNIHSNLDPAGRLCFICWRLPADNPWLAVPSAAAAPFLPEPPAADGPGPFAFADQDYVTNILTEAGFATPGFQLCEAILNVGTTMAEAIRFLTHIGPLSRVIAELDEATQRDAIAAVETALTPHVTESGVELGASCWIVTANATA